MRFLCLHGIGTSTAVLTHNDQTASLRLRLGDSHEFEFIEGPFVWPPARGIEEAFGKQEACYSYFDNTIASIHQAVLDLAEFLDSDEGPYDGIIGFSQGGALATTLIAAEERGLLPPAAAAAAAGADAGADAADTGRPRPRLKCAILLSSGQPWDFAALQAGENRRLLADRDGVCIHLPTAHFWGRNDGEGFLGNHEVAMVCEERVRVEFVHMAGHGVPSGARPAELQAMVEAFEMTVQRALAESAC
ncbi:hypothetical protein VMCG_03410 [Cytospora schulzeri]|uniref:Serine hydrolase domain-containing protein n=1 Tax=Cytospora schulzeri TaxID=448051 RepID=A0A423WWX9_9PEZI|nr:hypothetical protein VMCG_03410 [Valsa malicola]